MNQKPTGQASPSLETSSDAVVPVPTFSCLAYVRKNEDGTVSGRVANLDGIEASGAGERDVLVKLTSEFKSRVAGLMSAGKDVPWIEPPREREENEQIRRIPLHL